MVVILKLMPHRQDHHVGGILDLVQGNLAGAAKRDHQLSKKRTVCSLAIDEWRVAEAAFDGAVIRIKVLCGRCLPQQEIEQPLSGRSQRLVRMAAKPKNQLIWSTFVIAATLLHNCGNETRGSACCLLNDFPAKSLAVI